MKIISQYGRFLFYFAFPLQVYGENDLWPVEDMVRLPTLYMQLTAYRSTRLAALVAFNILLALFDLFFALLPLPFFTHYGTFFRWLGFRIGGVKDGYVVDSFGHVWLGTKDFATPAWRADPRWKDVP